MSISEKLVLLNQDIENAEAKIIEKGGSVTNNGSSNLADNIDTIPTESDTLQLNYVNSDSSSNYTFIKLVNMSGKKLFVNAPDFKSLIQYPIRAYNCPHLTVKFSDALETMYTAFYNGIPSYDSELDVIETITILNKTNLVNIWTYAFTNQYKLKTIDGIPLDFSSLSHNITDFCQNDELLENILFEQNTLSRNIAFRWSPNLTNESLISVANCLVAGNSVITLHATNKANCNTIMGYVDNTKGYDVFVADESGTVTLSEFITITKGWSLA